MAESMSVSAVYRFATNQAEVLEPIARGATRAAEAIDLATAALREFSPALSSVSRIARGAQNSVRGLSTTIKSFAGSVGISTDRAAAGFGKVEVAVTDAAGVVDKTTASMRAQIAAVGAAANATAASLRGMGKAASASAGAGASGGGGLGHGGSSAGGGAVRSAVDGVATVGSLGALALIASGIHGAAQLQNATVQTAIATGRLGKNYDQTQRNMAPMTDIAYKMSAMTGQSVVDSMNVVSTMASSGVKDSQIKALYKPIAQLADVLHFGKDQMGFVEAARMSAGLVHDLRLFKTTDLQSGFNRLAQVGYASPHGTQQLATQIRLFAPMFENFLSGTNAQKANKIIDTTAWLDRIGALNRGGSGISMLAQYLQQPKTKTQVAALEDLGIIDRKTGKNEYRDMKTGQFRFFDLLDDVMKRYQNAPNTPGGRGKILDDLRAFSANASRVFQSLVTPEALQARKNLEQQLSKMPGLNEIQTALMNNLTQQTSLLKTNVSSLAATLGEPLMKPLTKFIAALASGTSNTTDYLRSHPMERNIVTGALVAASVVGGYKLFRMVGGIAAFAHVAAHTARETAGIGAGVYLSRAGHGAAEAGEALVKRRGLMGNMGRVGKIGGSLLGFDILPSLKSFGVAIGDIGKLFGSFGLKTITTRGGLVLLGEVIAKIGLKAIPVVGNILLLVDTLKFLKDHVGDIGFAIGKAARWIHDTGAPMLTSAISAAWSAAMKAISESIPKIGGFIRDSIGNMFSGGGDSGVQGLEKRTAQGILDTLSKGKKAFDAGYGDDPNAATNAAARGHRRQKTSDRVTVVNHFTLHGEPAARVMRTAMSARHAAALVGGAPVSPHLVPAQTTGLGHGN